MSSCRSIRCSHNLHHSALIPSLNRDLLRGLNLEFRVCIMNDSNDSGRSSVLQARALQAFQFAIGSRRRLIVGIARVTFSNDSSRERKVRASAARSRRNAETKHIALLWRILGVAAGVDLPIGGYVRLPRRRLVELSCLQPASPVSYTHLTLPTKRIV